jgi:hypothetical protein
VIQPKGRLLIMEAVVPEGNEPAPAKMFDIFMMCFPDGLERTAAEYKALLAGSGFEMTSITPTQSPVCVIEARPV